MGVVRTVLEGVGCISVGTTDGACISSKDGTGSNVAIRTLASMRIVNFGFFVVVFAKHAVGYLRNKKKQTIVSM